MIKTISKTKRTLALIAIFFSTLAVMADLAITPVIGMIYGYYPDNMSAVNYIVSGPMLVLVVASLITPLLTRKLNKKSVFIVSTVIFSIGAIGGVLVDNPLYICFTRTLVGIGEGSNRQVEERMKALGGDMVSAYVFKDSLGYDDIAALRGLPGMGSVAPSKGVGGDLTAEGRSTKRSTAEASD